MLSILVQAGCDLRGAHSARRILHDLVMEADFRTGEVVGSGNQIAVTVLRVSRNTWHKWRGVLVSARLIEVRGVAVNGETDGTVFVSCLAWLSGVEEERAIAQTPAQAPAQAPAQELRGLNAPTSANTPEEVKNGRTEDKTTTALSLDSICDSEKDNSVVSDQEEGDVTTAVALLWAHIGLTGVPDREVIEAARTRMAAEGWTPSWLAQVVLAGECPDRWSRKNLLHRIRVWVNAPTQVPTPGFVYDLRGDESWEIPDEESG